MKIFIVGATGFIGRHLVKGLAADDHEVTALTRDAAKGRRILGERAAIIEGDPTTPGPWQDAIDGVDAVINMVGEPIMRKRWTPAQKQAIRDSRIKPTKLIVEAIERAEKKPGIFLGGSAVSYYGDRGDAIVTEDDGPADDYSAYLCRDWEEAAEKAAAYGVRVVMLRTSFVLGQSGALNQMAQPFKLWLGGPIGGGRQYIPWIHIDDYVGLCEFILRNERVAGPVNMAAGAATNRDFSAALGRALRRPSWLPVPAFALRLMLGEASVILLHGQRIAPRKATDAGYRFKFTDLDAALDAALG